MKSIYYIVTLGCLMVLFSCGKKDAFFEENKAIANKIWKVNDTVSFNFSIEDTTQLYDFYFNLRNLGNYEYSNIFIFYQLTFPNHKSLTDTAEFILAKPNGQWLGITTSTSIIENSMMFSGKKRFPLKGEYTFSVIHGMRKESLDNISDVGFKIKKNNEQK